MNSVATEELTSGLPHLLERVSAGEELLLTVHGQPRARLMPLEAASRSTEEKQARWDEYQKTLVQLSSLSRAKPFTIEEIVTWIRRDRERDH